VGAFLKGWATKGAVAVGKAGVDVHGGSAGSLAIVPVRVVLVPDRNKALVSTYRTAGNAFNGRDLNG
jgi:hypothetical protein